MSRPWWRLDEDRGVLWRPTSALALRGQWALGGGSPVLFHAVSLLLALLTAGLVAMLAARITGSGWAGVAGAAVFAVHPVHVEAVANVVGQAELWAALFVLAGLWVALRDPEGTGERMLRAVGVAAAYALALGAKEIAVTMPAALVLLRIAEDGRPRLRDDLALHLSMIAVLAAYLVLRAWVLGGVVGEDLAPPFRAVDGLGRIWTALSVLPFAWILLVAPFRLSADYDPGHFAVVSFPHPSGWVGLALGIALIGIAVRGWRNGGLGRVAAMGVLWVVVVRLPVSNLVIPSGVLLAERTLFLPSVGIAFVVAALLTHLRTRSGPDDLRHAGRRAAVALVGVIVVAFSARSALRTPVWRSTFTVMASLGVDAPASWRTLRTLAVGRLNQGDTAGGLEAMGVAFDALPWRYDLAAEYGANLNRAGRHSEAREVLEWTVEHWPDRVEGYNLLAEMHLTTRSWSEAWLTTVNAIRETGGNGRTWGLLSEAHLAANRLDAAVQARRTSVALDPTDAASVARLEELEDVVRQLEAARAAGGEG